MAEPVGVDRARGSAKQSSASGRSQIRSYSYGSGARRFDPGAWPSSRPRLVVAIVGRPCVGARAIRIATGESGVRGRLSLRTGGICLVIQE